MFGFARSADTAALAAQNQRLALCIDELERRIKEQRVAFDVNMQMVLTRVEALAKRGEEGPLP